MLATSERVRPCRLRDSRSSSGRATCRVPSSERSMVMGAGTVWLRVPFGPFTVTDWPSRVTSTPLGTGMGRRPMRDMVRSSSLVDVGEDFSAYALLVSLATGEQTGGRRDDRHPERATGRE